MEEPGNAFEMLPFGVQPVIYAVDQDGKYVNEVGGEADPWLVTASVSNGTGLLINNITCAFKAGLCQLIHGLSPPLCPTGPVCSSTTSPVPSRPDSASLKTWQLTQWATTTNSRSRSHMDRTPLKTQPAQDLMSAAGPSPSSSQIWTFSILRELPSLLWWLSGTMLST